jgi:hypothetical protein
VISVLIVREPLCRLACCERSRSSLSPDLSGTLDSCTGSTGSDEDAAKVGGTEEKCEGKVSPINRNVAEGSRSRCPSWSLSIIPGKASSPQYKWTCSGTVRHERLCHVDQARLS